MIKVKCSCGVELYNNRWQDHYKTHPECRKRNEEIKKQEKIKECSFVCEWCTARFKAEKYLIRHLINDCKSIPEDKKPLNLKQLNELQNKKTGIKCEECGSFYKELGNHLSQTHHISINEYCLKYSLKKEDLSSKKSKQKRTIANTINGKIGNDKIQEKLKNKDYKLEWGRKISESHLSNNELLQKRRECLSLLNQREDFREKSSQTMKKTWKKNRELMLKNLEKNRKKIIELYGENFFSSKLEIEIGDWIESFVEINRNNRSIIPPQELDIYIPSHNLAIEFDGLYWHSDLFKDSDHHLKKTLICEEKGIRLIHIFEDEWIYKKKIVKSRLKNILGLNSRRIGARKCIIEEISSKEKNDFLEKYHIQGGDKSSIKLGAFYEDELVGVMTFGFPRLSMGQKEKSLNKYELIRFATVSDTFTPGLASKLLQYFIRKYSPFEIYSYADRRWSQGNLYKSIGFEFEHFTKPNYWYVKNQKREHRFVYRKQVLKDLFPEVYSSNKTEFQIMDEMGFLRIYDCGNYKYIWNLKTF